MGWACICRVRPSSYGYLEMLRIRIVPRKEHWLGRSQVRVDYFVIRELGTCGFVDVRALEQSVMQFIGFALIVVHL